MSLGSLLWFSIQNLAASEERSSKAVISLRANSTPLSKVLQTISKASGYTIVLNANIEDVPISIQLTDVTLHEAIRRIFQPYDHVEIWDDAGKKLELYIWGNKGPPVSISGSQRKFEPSTKTIQ